jgi:hypothetical protein
MDQRMNEPRQGRKDLSGKDFFRPCRGSIIASPYQGFAALTPGYFLIAPAGACVRKIVSRQKLDTLVARKAEVPDLNKRRKRRKGASRVGMDRMCQ